MNSCRCDKRAAKANVIDMADTEENKKILEAVPELTKAVAPPCGGKWSGTIMHQRAMLFNWGILPVSRHNWERVILPDGGNVNLEWYCDTHPKSCATVLICPGMTHTTQSYVCSSLANVLAKAGFNVVGFNCRGYLSELTSPKFGWVDSWKDMPYVLRAIGEHIHGKDATEAAMQNMKMFGVGMSMGGAILSRYMVEQDLSGDSDFFDFGNLAAMPKISGQALICPAMSKNIFDHDQMLAKKNRMGRISSAHMTSVQKWHAFAYNWNNPHLQSMIEKVGWAKCWNDKHLDQQSDSIAKAHGFENWAQAAEETDSVSEVGRHKNSVPTLIIIPRDDRVINCDLVHPPEPIPEKVIYVEPTYGQHLAFGTLDLGWANDALAKYFTHLASNMQQSSSESLGKKDTRTLLSFFKKSRG